MNRVIAAAFVGLTVSLFAPIASAAESNAALFDGDPAAGEASSAVCASCHGPNGNSVTPQWPKLAGQGARYLAKQLHNFKDPQASGRDNAIMMSQVAALSDEDMANLAAYFATQKTSGGSADPELVDAGQTLYRAGDRTRGIPACTGCHSPRGLGNAAAGYPRLSGQHAEYLTLQLQAFRDGARANDDNRMMRDVAARLTDADIAAVSSYLQGLR